MLMSLMASSPHSVVWGFHCFYGIPLLAYFATVQFFQSPREALYIVGLWKQLHVS